MDDGSIKSKQSKGVILNTQGFTETEVLLLCKIRKQKDGNQIYISGHSYELLKSLIYSFIIDSMRYKFPKDRIIKNNKLTLKTPKE